MQLAGGIPRTLSRSNIFWAVEHDLRCGTLVRLLPEYTVLTDRLNAVYADRAFLSAKVRSFIDFLNEKIENRKDCRNAV